MDPYDVEEFLAGVGEMLAQGVGHDHAGLALLLTEQLGDERHAAAAPCSGLGAGLESGDVGATSRHCGADGALVDVVAGADDRRVGEGADTDRGADRALASREDQLLRVLRRGHVAPAHLDQHLVDGGVTDKHPADHAAPTTPIGGPEDEALVDAGHGITEGDGLAVGSGGERVAEAGHVDPHQLELGGHVGAREGGVAPEEPIGGHPGHLVAGRDQAENATGVEGAFPDGEDAGVRRAARLVDHHAAALTDGQTAVAGELVTGPDAGREHEQVDGQIVALLEAHPRDAPRAIAQQLGGDHAGVDRHAQFLDSPAQHRPSALVHLYRHQSIGELDDVGLQPEALERVSRFESEEPTADDGPDPPAARIFADGLEVVEGAVDETAGHVIARHRRYEGVRAGGQHEGVVGDPLTGRRHHLRRTPID